ncbi:uncharacterized protein [Lolium perenne]|uniref:uncharacterized protein isoform X2 n=1 Tax=Lolium perenne TaxID=4522 RepID=UPI0021F51C8D|nr:uncharacterized protein LOC127300493 isoform X2 [Lolium perenne]XP_051186576.1 uncharacterized protein LOC127300493 isoform X2 [Lolium perenne]
MAAASSSSSSSDRFPLVYETLLLSFKPRVFPNYLVEVDARRTDPAAHIFVAAVDGDIPKMKRLAKQRKREGKSVEVVEEITGYRGSRSLGALHVAAFSGKHKMCKFLIKDLRLDVNAAAEHGLSPLLCAIYGIAPKRIVELLLDRGANPDIPCTEGFTALHVLATIKVFPDLFGVADILLSRGANVDSMSSEGTPLHFAAQCGNVEMMKVLLKYKPNPNTVVRLFYAPLTMALFASSLKCVELLIKAGADVNAGNPATPLTLAATDGLADCINCLLEAHADPNIPDEIGRMPVELAAIHGWRECVEILFPVTSRVARFADWSIDGIMQQCSEGNLHKSEEPAFKALGDAAFKRKDYTHASALYTKGMETGPKDSTLYAKRSLCWLRMGEKEKALDDAHTCKCMILDGSNCFPEQGAALIPTEDYGQASEALISSLKLDSGSSLVDEVSGEEDK